MEQQDFLYLILLWIYLIIAQFLTGKISVIWSFFTVRGLRHVLKKTFLIWDTLDKPKNTSLYARGFLFKPSSVLEFLILHNFKCDLIKIITIFQQIRNFKQTTEWGCSSFPLPPFPLFLRAWGVMAKVKLAQKHEKKDWTLFKGNN